MCIFDTTTLNPSSKNPQSILFLLFTEVNVWVIPSCITEVSYTVVHNSKACFDQFAERLRVEYRENGDIMGTCQQILVVEDVAIRYLVLS